ncbi:phosphoribosylformylglycinamidine synthase subunit PurQ [Oceanotoga sp. DSM 15011]|jgi:phosphoribosylformylglycinamidine synthase|uniref:Phosphoribosylformylglycinamidine synthase subunit PurQ n=1 Tax=Oceanotoga teriensis TaxID=515440 RepID=A0AA45C8L5_9BACT|nr:MULTISPECIES: phosphoribosylformylglycinamidine synthase subunit PurQ [Oceanotoga]MDN5342082.1 phosphoribosylformylglycinamidine synthase subunit PurQ / glutaminase [Oceanotoga sp.]MDO7975448.1 phosphoribosylformylglycinamidine synthase subunit PurQ [Oceanotoga teriensis]PWJ96264.1 phosphoribosylformylglycinamidine synthase subunit I [Oceanotoga teriensis]UYP00048.1 phosphoribosylformylglycinamidine synthase subunit PurQ [Oceanotoga sp. DSM 15011]
MKKLKAGVIVFPGSNCDKDAYFALEKSGFNAEYIWHDFEKTLDYDFLFIPGGFSYGDYLRAGALAKFSPVMKSVEKYIINERGLVMGICNGFQILSESGLLPGALAKNKHHKFICKNVELDVINKKSPFTSGISKEKIILPIAHMEGNYMDDYENINKLESKNLISFKYTDNPNGSMNNIAGIINEKGNVMGMMPHPERNTVKLLGNGDGAYIFLSIRRHLENGN